MITGVRFRVERSSLTQPGRIVSQTGDVAKEDLAGVAGFVAISALIKPSSRRQGNLEGLPSRRPEQVSDRDSSRRNGSLVTSRVAR
jgi:hypothetical protein